MSSRRCLIYSVTSRAACSAPARENLPVRVAVGGCLHQFLRNVVKGHHDARSWRRLNRSIQGLLRQVRAARAWHLVNLPCGRAGGCRGKGRGFKPSFLRWVAIHLRRGATDCAGSTFIRLLNLGSAWTRRYVREQIDGTSANVGGPWKRRLTYGRDSYAVGVRRS
jgi:hypothetical protein